MISSTRRRIAAAGTVAVAALGLTACGGSSSTAAGSGTGVATPAASSSAAPAAGRAGGGFGGLSTAELTKATACLKAAGITVPTMGTRPSGAPGNGTRPSGAPGGAGGFGGTPPSGAPGGGGAGGPFGSTAAQAALKACGITLPTRTGTQPAPAASASA